MNREKNDIPLREHTNLKHSLPDSEGTLSTRENYRSTQCQKNPPPSQLLKRGHASVGTAGDAGDGIGIELSAMERIKDQCVRVGEMMVRME